MKNLTDYINEAVVNEATKQSDLKAFFEWIQSIGGGELIGEDIDDILAKVDKSGISDEQFEKYADIFFEVAFALDNHLSEIEENGYEGSDDSREYASWGAVCRIENLNQYKKLLKTKDENDILDLYWDAGESVGYAMNLDSYKEWKNKNK